jgi:hypothetical protein
MNKPPIPTEKNPKQHQELPGEPPANWPADPQGQEEQDLNALYEQEELVRSDDLYHQRKDPLNNPRSAK